MLSLFFCFCFSSSCFSFCQNLHEYLNNLVEAISITPADEAILRTPQVVLDAALKSADDDAGPAVEKVQYGNLGHGKVASLIVLVQKGYRKG